MGCPAKKVCNVAAGGIGASTHLGGELLKFVAGIDVKHVP